MGRRDVPKARRAGRAAVPSRAELLTAELTPFHRHGGAPGPEVPLQGAGVTHPSTGMEEEAAMGVSFVKA